MKQIILAFLLIVTVLGLITSCTKDGMLEDVKDMHGLRNQLMDAYPDENIAISLQNSNHLAVIFTNSDLKELDSSKKQAIAKNVEDIIQNYFEKGRITSGSLTFYVNKNYIIFKYEDNTDTYRFDFADEEEEERSLE